MKSTGPSETYPITKRCESSLLRSLASIHANPFRESRPSRCQSMNDKVRYGRSNQKISSETAATGQINRLCKRNTFEHGLVTVGSLNCSPQLKRNSCMLTLEKRNVRTPDMNIDKAVISHESRRLSASELAETSDVTESHISSIQSTEREWPPLLNPRPVPNLNNGRNTHLLAASHNSRNIGLTFPTVALSSGPHLLQKRHSMIETGHRNQQDHSSIDPRAAAARPSLLPKRYSESKLCGFRKDYSLGQVARSSSHMVIESSFQEAANRISELKPYDFAFVKRTNNSWTYAILACRSVDESQEECMLFVLSLGASTKTIKKRKWVEFIRCVVAQKDCLEDEMGSCESHSKLVETEYCRQLRVACIPEVILVEKNCEDCSLISLEFY